MNNGDDNFSSKSLQSGCMSGTQRVTPENSLLIVLEAVEVLLQT